MNIIITGASGGIGQATAREFAKNGTHNLVLISRNEERLIQLSKDLKKYKSKVLIQPLDINLHEISELKHTIDGLGGKIDILINNAGSLINKPFSEITTDDFDQVCDTNFKSPFFLIQTLLPFFNNGAHIVNISSMGGYQGSVKFPGLSAYSSSKGALSILTECLALELSEKGISVNCLALGSVQTPMLEKAFPGFVAQTSPDEMAQYISWFAMHAHKWMNGKVLPVSLSTP